MPFRSPVLPRKFAAAFLAIALALMAPLSVNALSVAPITDEQMLAQSSTVVTGKVLKKSSRWMTPEKSMIGTDCVILVEEVLLNESTAGKKVASNTTMTLTFAGGTIGSNTVHLPGVPCLEVGEAGVFCLDEKSANALVPVTGTGKGLYRFYKQPDGKSVVVQGENCKHNGSPSTATPLRKTFFSKEINRPAGITPDEFVADLKASLPRAKSTPELRVKKQTQIPAGKEHLVFTGDQIPQISPVNEPANTSQDATIDAKSLPDTYPTPQPSSSATPEQTGTFRLATDSNNSGKPGTEPKYGFFATPPSPPRTFNIPPIYYGSPNFGGAFESSMAEWNKYAGLFNKKAQSQNNFGGNFRNDFAFTNDSTLFTKYGFQFDGALAICVTYSNASNKITESDILINQAYTWTLDFATAYNNDDIFYFRTAALHELGHAFGLEHQFDVDASAQYHSVMNYFTAGNFITEAGRIFLDDADAIRFAYPSRAKTITDIGIHLFYTDGDGNGNDGNEVYWSDFPDAVEIGGTLPLPLDNMIIENIGTSARAPRVRFSLVTSPLTFTGQVECAVGNFPSIPAKQGGFAATDIPIPANTPPGTYYLAAQLLDDDGNNFNNVAWANVPITVVMPPPENDNFADAFSITGLTGSVNGYNDRATRETGEPVYLAAKSVWWNWTAPTTTKATFSTVGSNFDTLLGVYFGNSVSTLANLGQNDDHGGILASRVQFDAVQGTTYRIAVDGYGGSAGNITLNWFQDTPFTTEFSDTSLGTWQPSGQDSGPENFFDPTSPDDVNVSKSVGIVQAIVHASPENGGRQKIAGWSKNNVLSADDVGPNKWVRGKFYIYTNRPFTDNLNTVSNFRIRLQNDAAILGGMNYEYAATGHGASYEPIYNIFNNPDTEIKAGQFLRPSATESKPSLYRANLDPIDVPALAGTGIGAVFESFSFVAPSDCILTLTEFVAGTYDARKPAFGDKIFEYDRALGATDGAGGPKTIAFSGFNIEANIEAGRRQELKFPGLDPADPYSPALVASGSHSTGPTGGIRMNTSAAPSDKFGVGVIRLVGDGSTPNQEPRIQFNKLYHTRFYITSPVPTTSTNANATIFGSINLISQTAAGAATAFLYINGPANANDVNSPSKQIITQSAPGIGTFNPDYDEPALTTPGEDGGWYSVVMSSPWNNDIRQDGNTFGTFATEPGPGGTSASAKSMNFGADLLQLPRNLKFGPNPPFNNFPYAQPNNVNIRISKVEVYEHAEIDDGGYGY